MLNRSIFELVGGEETFKTLVQRFYSAVATDKVLRAVYPEEDLSGATERLTLFLIQYWGRPRNLQRAPGPPATAYAAPAVCHRAGRTRCMASSHVGCSRLPGPRAGGAQGAARLLR